MSRNAASHRTPSTATRSDDDVMKETRKLLNALNEENAELKSQNDSLNSKLRRASDALVAMTEERDALEKDMKEINFNLMQQLRTKTTSIKDLEAHVEQLTLREKESMNECHRVERLRQELESELMIVRERLTVTDEQNRKAQRKVDEAVQSSQEHSAQAHELRAEIDKLRAQLRSLNTESQRQQNSAAESRSGVFAQLESERGEHQIIVDNMTRQIANLTADARRTAAAEAEALFAHDEMAQMANISFDQLTAASGQVRVVSEAVMELDASLGSQLFRVRDLTQQLHSLRHNDEILLSYVLDERKAAEAELRRVRTVLEQCQMEVKSNSADRDGLTTELGQLRRQLDITTAALANLEVDAEGNQKRLVRLQSSHDAIVQELERERRCNEDARKALLEADAALGISASTNGRLEEELAKATAALTECRNERGAILEQLNAQHETHIERLVADVAALEDENDVLQAQLRDQADTLAHTLARFQQATVFSGRRSLSQTGNQSHRSFSTDSAVPTNASRFTAQRHAGGHSSQPAVNDSTS